MANTIATVSFGQFVERVKRWLSNNWSDIADTTTSNEIILYLWEAPRRSHNPASK